MNKILKGLILLVIFLIQCGIPSSDLYDDLNTPKNLTWVDTGALSDGQIIISFTAYNPEIAFTGYNVYMSTVSDADLRYQKSIHVVNQVVNTDVERDYIVKNKISLAYPTIQDNDGVGVGTAISTPTSITFTIIKGPNESTLLSAVTYYIGVTAYSSPNFIESGLSEVITAQP